MLVETINKFVKMFIKLEVYHSSTISDYTTNNFYSLQRVIRNCT